MISDVTQCKRFTRQCGPFVSPEYARRQHSLYADKAHARNVVLMLYADGVSGTKRTDYSMFVICCMVVNLPREQRRLRANIFPLMVIPGPRPPKDMTSFLQPLIDELASLWADGTEIVTLDSDGGMQRQRIRAMLFSITADSRAHPKLSMMMQSPAAFPCHLCEVQVSINIGPHAHFVPTKYLPITYHDPALTTAHCFLNAFRELCTASPQNVIDVHSIGRVLMQAMRSQWRLETLHHSTRWKKSKP